eukprot:6182977-Pleurochrysis_carterae.AAC.2
MKRNAAKENPHSALPSRNLHYCLASPSLLGLGQPRTIAVKYAAPRTASKCVLLCLPQHSE